MKVLFDEKGNAVKVPETEEDIKALKTFSEENHAVTDISKVEREDQKVTSIADMVAYNAGAIVRLPDFAEGQPFIARMRRPSMMVLAKNGKIPNALLTKANELFTGSKSATDVDDIGMLSDVFEVCELMADACLIEPSYKDIKNAGIELTDEQMMAIMSYAQSGTSELEKFHK